MWLNKFSRKLRRFFLNGSVRINNELFRHALVKISVALRGFVQLFSATVYLIFALLKCSIQQNLFQTNASENNRTNTM